MKKSLLYRLTALLVLFVLLMGLAGCSGGSTEAPEPSPEATVQAEPDSPELSPEEIAYLEELYCPHKLVGIMANY